MCNVFLTLDYMIFKDSSKSSGITQTKLSYQPFSISLFYDKSTPTRYQCLFCVLWTCATCRVKIVMTPLIFYPKSHSAGHRMRCNINMYPVCCTFFCVNLLSTTLHSSWRLLSVSRTDCGVCVCVVCCVSLDRLFTTHFTSKSAVSQVPNRCKLKPVCHTKVFKVPMKWPLECYFPPHSYMVPVKTGSQRGIYCWYWLVFTVTNSTKCALWPTSIQSAKSTQTDSSQWTQLDLDEQSNLQVDKG